MLIGTTLIVIAVTIVAIWMIVEMRRAKHKVFAIFLISFILFGYISAMIVFRGQETDFKSFSGIIDATNIYLSWLGSLFGNMRSITSYAVKMDWSNETIEENNEGFLNSLKREDK